jgi:glycosyltransferase involved in cell wall biosynthesis
MQNKLSRKKNILIFFWYYVPPGGAEVFIKETTKRLQEHYNFEMITAQCNRKLPKKEHSEGLLVHRVGIGNFLIDKLLFPVFALWRAYKIKKAKHISLIHAVIANPAGLAAMVFHSMTNTPFLLTEQSGNLDRKVKKLTLITFFIYRKIYQTADFIQVITNFLKKTIVNLGVDEKKIEVIPNGINLSHFKSEQQEKNRIICIARLEKYKGVRYLLEALPKIIEKFPDSRLVLIGDGSEKEILKSKARALNLENLVEFKGDILHERVAEELSRSHVFVLPSLEEGQGLVVLEAQAAQIPVVATNIGGIPDFIENEKSGFLIEPKNSKAISDSIIRIFSDHKLSQKIIEAAKVNLEKYDWDNITLRVDQIYKNLLL